MATPAERKEDTLNLKTISNELATVAFKFFSIGVNLGVPFHKLKEFGKDDNPLLCTINYLLTNRVCPLSWHCIVQALKSDNVGEPGLAKKISEKYYCEVHTKQDSSRSVQSHTAEPAAAAESVITSQSSSGSSSWTPPAVNLASYFPYLSITERKNSYYLQKLKDETDEIVRKFDQLYFGLLKDLENSTSLEDVVTLLAISCNQKFKLVFKDCQNLADIFISMRNFISFIDYGPIKLLASTFASNSFKKKLKKYKKKFQEYAKRRICECPSYAFKDCEESEIVFAIKTEIDLNKLTIEEEQKLEYELNKILGHTLLRLINVKDGCTELFFRTLEDGGFSISEYQKQALKMLGVTNIKYGEELIIIAVQEVVKSEKITDCASDSGVHTRETITTSSEAVSNFYAESQRTETTFYACQKERDLKDPRIDMIVAAESKPKELPCFSPLHDAIYKGKLQRVKALIINRDENPLVQDINGDTCLHYAAQLYQFEILKYLIEDTQCIPGTTGWNGTNVLHLAARTKQLGMVQYLVESENCKLDPTIEDNNGHSALHHACSGGDLKIVRYLIKSMSDCMKLEDIVNNNVILPGQLESNANQIEDFTQSLLSCACFHGNVPIIKYLVDECHQDPSQPQGSKQKLPIESAIIGNQLRVIKYLVETLNFKNFDDELVFLAVLYSSTKVIGYLIQTLHLDFNKEHSSSTPLQLACLHGRIDMVRYLITAIKCDPNARAKHGSQPIHFASKGGQLSIVKYLIQRHSSKAFSRNDDGETPLHIASQRGHLDIVKYLTTTHKCDPLSTCKSVGSSLHAAASGGHIHIARYFVEHMKCDSNSRTGINHCTPLHVAAECGHLDFVKYMIEELSCDPNSRDDCGRTSLMQAASKGMISVVQYLVNKKKCRIYHTDNNGYNVVHYAANSGKIDILKILIETQKMDINMPYTIKGFTPACLAVYNNHLPVVCYLLEKGCQHNDRNSRTLLHLAAFHGHLDIVKYIMNDSHLSSMYTYTSSISPLHCACICGHLNIIKYFIEEKGCDPQSVTDTKNTLVHFVAEFGQLEVLKYLHLEAKCDYLSENDQNMTPFQRAALKGQLNVVKYFVEVLNCDCKTSNAMHLAAQSGELDMLKYLVYECECNPSLLYDNKMPIHHAASTGNLDVVKYLVEELNVNPMATGTDESTPLHHATMCGQLEVVKYLLEEQNCNPCAEDIFEITPLNQAAVCGHFHVIQYLICERKIKFSIDLVSPFIHSLLATDYFL